MTGHHPDHEVELFRDSGAYVVIVDVPGYDADDIDVRWHDRRLHVHAEQPTAESSWEKVVNKKIGLPHDVDADAITAEYEDGVLEVTLPTVEGSEAPGTRVDVE